MSHETEEQYRSIFENAVEGIYQTTVDGRYLRVNPALADIYGYASPEDLIANLTDIACQLYVDPGKHEAFADLMARQDRVHSFEARVFRRDGSIIWIAESARCVRDAAGRIRYYEGTVQDITERKQHEEKIRLLATVFDSVADGILIVDPELTVQAINPAYEIMTGFQREELLRRPLVLFAPGSHEREFIDAIWTTARQAGRWQGEVTSFRHSGDAFAAALSVTSVRAPSGVLEHYVLTIADISQRKSQEHQIRYQASFDRLTDLPNRWLVCERLEEAIVRAQRSKSKVAVAFLDLNRFKQVNDTLGHQSGDELLRLLAKRLPRHLREQDTLARLGGDEFAIVLPNIAEQDDVRKLAERLIEAVRQPFEIAGHTVPVSVSIGIAISESQSLSADHLLRYADMALYEAKRNGRNCLAFFEPDMEAAALRRHEVEMDLRQAIISQQLQLYYQPIMDVSHVRIVGREALMRWQHPKKGLIMPQDFIPIAEETGLIHELGAFTLHEACLEATRWDDHETVAVNLSASQFTNGALVSLVESALAKSGLPARRLELEITESVLLTNSSGNLDTLHRLKELGVKVALDDFGTGYSSLGYLRTFEFDKIKIDKSFTQDVGSSREALAIIRAINGIGRSLDIPTTAEGVETPEQLQRLTAEGCSHFQGYLLGRPVSHGDTHTGPAQTYTS